MPASEFWEQLHGRFEEIREDPEQFESHYHLPIEGDDDDR